MRSNQLASPAAPLLALIAEPDTDTFDLYKTILVSERCAVEQAISGPDAFAKAFGDPPDMIFAELRLPVFDGFTLCRLLKSDPKTRSVPIVVVTGDARPTAIEQARQAGASAVVVKPCLPETLIEHVQRVRDIAEQQPVRSLPEAPRRGGRSIGRAASQQHQRFVTTTPSLYPPALRCPDCDFPLAYVHSHVGGVNGRAAEQWDHFRCQSGCGTFEYRHRTRSLRGLTPFEAAAALRRFASRT